MAGDLRRDHRGARLAIQFAASHGHGHQWSMPVLLTDGFDPSRASFQFPDGGAGLRAVRGLFAVGRLTETPFLETDAA